MSPDPAVTVAIVNDYEIVVRGIAAVLAPYDARVRVVELDAGTTVAADVDVLLYDTFGQVQADTADLAGLGGGPDTRIVIFSWNTAPELVERALTAGAHGYVSKGLDGDGLVEAIERVHGGEQVRPEPEATGDGFGAWPGRDQGLSARESEVLALICQGLTNQEIGERAFIGINTVKTHIRAIYRKIDVTSRSRAVGWGFAHGFDPDTMRETADGAP